MMLPSSTGTQKGVAKGEAQGLIEPRHDHRVDNVGAPTEEGYREDILDQKLAPKIPQEISDEAKREPVKANEGREVGIAHGSQQGSPQDSPHLSRTHGQQDEQRQVGGWRWSEKRRRADERLHASGKEQKEEDGDEPPSHRSSSTARPR